MSGRASDVMTVGSDLVAAGDQLALAVENSNDKGGQAALATKASRRRFTSSLWGSADTENRPTGRRRAARDGQR